MAAGLRFHTEAGLLTSFIAALPFPVSQWFARPLPYTVTASFRIRTGFPFHLLLNRHLCATTLYFFRRTDYITLCRIVNVTFFGHKERKNAGNHGGFRHFAGKRYKLSAWRTEVRDGRPSDRTSCAPSYEDRGSGSRPSSGWRGTRGSPAAERG